MPRTGELLPDLAFSGGGVDRRAELREDPALLDRLLQDPATRVVELAGDRAPTSASGSVSPSLLTRPPTAADGAGEALRAYLGEVGGTAYVLVAGPAQDEPDPDWRTLRQVGADLSRADAELFVTALGLANWHRTHGHCPRCGAPTEPAQAGWVRRCPRDESLHFPRTDPAVIMAVVDDRDRILLARGRGFTTIGMSVLAGFVEPGENLATAVAREVREEVGLEVTEVTYLGDQPWPFPASLMIGFWARAVTGELALQESEIEAARWFSREELVAAIAAGELAISPRLSIARRLIEHWYGAPLESPELSVRR